LAFGHLSVQNHPERAVGGQWEAGGRVAGTQGDSSDAGGGVTLSSKEFFIFDDINSNFCSGE